MEIAAEAKQKARGFLGISDKGIFVEKASIEDLAELYKGLSRMAFESCHLVGPDGSAVEAPPEIEDILDEPTAEYCAVHKSLDMVLEEMYKRLGEDGCFDIQCRKDDEILWEIEEARRNL